MASLQHGIYSSRSDTHTPLQDASLHYSDYSHQVTEVYGSSALISWGNPAPTPTPDPGQDYSHYQTLLHFEKELADDYLAVQPIYPSPLGLEGAAGAHELPASIPDPSSTAPFSENVYQEWYSSSISLALHSAADAHEQSYDTGAYPAMPVFVADSSAQEPVLQAGDPLVSAAGSPSPVYSAYSAIAEALGCCPSDIYTPSPSFASTAPHPVAEQVAVEINEAESTTKSCGRQSGRIHPRASSSSPGSPYPTSPAESSSSSCGPSSDLITTPRRNAAVPPNTRPTVSANRWKCPYCPYVQRSRRKPDYDRHVTTHTRRVEVPDFLCCGVPLIDAAEYGVPAGAMDKEPGEYEGMVMVGGCGKTFSRRDALGRHLRRYKGVCFGDALAPYLPGNQGGDH